jgi:hypothetical protein
MPKAVVVGVWYLGHREALGLPCHAGEVKLWSRATDSGGTLACAFCPACGSRVWHEAIEATDTVSVKGGSMDEPPDLQSACHIWTARKLPGVVIPEGARQFPGEPD